MTAWLVYFKESSVYNEQYIKFHIEEGHKLGIDVKLILVENLEFGVRNNKWFLTYENREITRPDFAISRAIYPLLNRQLELMKIPVFNNSQVAEICNDKAKTYQYLAKTGIKMVDTSFFKKEQVETAISRSKSPTVIKAVDGHGGSQVFLVNDKKEQQEFSAEKENMNFIKNTEVSESGEKENNGNNRINGNSGNDIIDSCISQVVKGLGSSDAVLQPLTGNRHQDLRVYVIGKEIVAAVLRTAKEGFRSNFSLGGEVRLYSLSEEEKSIVHQIIGQFDFGLVGIDFIIGDQGELIFNEIEDVVGSRMLYQCSDINIVEKYLNYILNRLSYRKG